MTIEDKLDKILDELKILNSNLLRQKKESEPIIDENKKCYLTIKQLVEKNKKNGIWPDSEGSIRAIRFRREEMGAEKVFITAGRRILIDIEELENWIKTNPKSDINVLPVDGRTIDGKRKS